MKKRLIAPLMALAFSGMTGSAVASTIGLPGGVFATTWDTFAGINVANDAPDASTTQVNATLTTTMTAGSAPQGGLRLYSGSGPTPNPFSLSVNGTATMDISHDFALVLKFSSPDGTLNGAANHFNVALAGAGAGTRSFLGTTSELAGTMQTTFYIYQWTWANYELDANEAFSFAISSAPGHVSLDAVQIVPEPGSAVLGALGAAMLVIRRRRK